MEVDEADDGTLTIEGVASDFETDRDMEAFEPNAFERGMKAYLETNPVLIFHHKPHMQLGQVTQAWIEGKSLRIRAEMPRPPESAGELLHIYNLVKRGMMRGFSVGGHFARRMTPSGPRIHDVDWQETSVTPLPVNPRSLFAVAGKAFGEDPDEDALRSTVDRLEAIFNGLAEYVR